MNKYLKVWLKTAFISIQDNLNDRGAAVVFILAKSLRFGGFLLFLVLIGENISQVSGYNMDELIIIFLFFNLFDIFGQTFFRGVYFFRQQIITGEFDFRLIKPISSLFQALTGFTDILDVPLFLAILAALVYKALTLDPLTLLMVLAFAFFGLVIVTSIHILVVSLGILTTEVDHTIMIYRDISTMARVPIDIYPSFIQFLLTFILPIGIAYTLPAKAFLNLISPGWLIISAVVSLSFFFFSLRFWHYSIKHYSSASS